MTGPHTVPHASSLRLPRGARTSVDGAPVLGRVIRIGAVVLLALTVMLDWEIRGHVANGMSVSEAFSAAIQFSGDAIFLAP
jgi:hypothetical protein